MIVEPASMADEVRRRGFAVWPGFASPEEHEALKQAASTIASSESARHYPKSTRAWDLYQYNSVFNDVVTKPELIDLLGDLLGQHFLLSDYSLNVVKTEQPVDDWHIDYPFNEMRRLVSADDVLGLQCVLTLDPFTELNGATRLVPGSHLAPQQPSEPDPSIVETFTAAPGTLLIMAAATWHRSGYNSSAHPRAAILMSFVEHWIRPLSDPLPPEQWANDPRLQIMLGLQRAPETINGVPI